MKKLLALFVLTAFLAVGFGSSVKAADNISSNTDISVVFDKDPAKDGGDKTKKSESKKESSSKECSKKESSKCSSSKNPEKNCGSKAKTSASTSKSCCSESKASKS